MLLPATYIIIGITCLISISAFSNQRLKDEWVFYPPAITQRNQWYRFITSGFLHADAMHLIFNMISLYSFGVLWERVYVDGLGYSPVVYYGFYLLAIIASDIPSYLKNRNNYSYSSLGASGAVSAIIFSTILYFPWKEIAMFLIPMPAILFAVLFLAGSYYLDKKGNDNIGHSAHLFGGLFGLATAIVLNPGVVRYFFAQVTSPPF